MYNARDSVDWHFIDQKLQLCNIGASESRILIVQRSISFRRTLEFAEEVFNELGKWNVVLEDDLRGSEEVQLHLLATIDFA